MGIPFESLRRMDALSLLKPGGAVLDIGSSNLYSATVHDVVEFLAKYAPDSTDIELFANRIAAGSRYDPVHGGINGAFVGELLEKAGMSYTAFDIADGYRTTILDLNHTGLPQSLRSRFDLVLNFGTTEHILNQFNCFKVIHDATKVGGHIFHSLPAIGYVDHGYITYTGRCLFDIAGYNEYEIVEFWFEGPAGSNNLYDSARSYQHYFPALGRTLADIEHQESAKQLNALNVPDVSINVIYRKVKEKPFWGALESSTSVGSIPDTVTGHYSAGGKSGIAPESGVAAPPEDVSLRQRVSVALQPFPALKTFAGKTYRLLKKIQPVPAPLDRPAITETTSVDPSPDQANLFDHINTDQGLWVAIERLGHRKLVGLNGADANRKEYQRFFQETMQVLGSEAFSRLPITHQVSAMTAIYNTTMSGILRESLIIADLMAIHYSRLLRSSELSEAQACRIYDCLYGLYFAGAQSLSDMRKFDSGCVMPFDSWLRKRLPLADAPTLSGPTPRNIAYFINCAHFDKGNAVSPIVASLVRAHSQREDRRIFIYAVQWISGDFSSAFDGRVTVREFQQDYEYNKLDAIAAQMRADQIDVAISDLNSSVAASLFTRRVAPLQMWVSMGFPYWSLSGLDWALLPGTEYQGSFGVVREKCSLMRVKQDGATLAQKCPAEDILAARKSFPEGSFVLAIFSRLIKVSAQLLDVASRVLLEEPRAHLLIVGTGDPRSIYDFIESPELAGRVTFLHRNVDLNAYGPAIDAMFDTFPFHGGNVCREVNVHGKPVLSINTPDWEKLLVEERDPWLLARNPEELLSFALRLIRDERFYQERSIEAIHLTKRVTNTAEMIDDIESAISRAASICMS